MQTVDWLWLIHPALAVVVVYPLLGMVLRLARRLSLANNARHGRGGVLLCYLY